MKTTTIFKSILFSLLTLVSIIWTQEVQAQECKINSAYITPHGLQRENFVQEGGSFQLKIDTENCIDRDLEIIIYEEGQTPDKNSHSFKGKLTKDKITATYKAGDIGCNIGNEPDGIDADAVEGGYVADCEIYFLIQFFTPAGEGVVRYYKSEDKLKGEIHYNCWKSTSNPQVNCTQKWSATVDGIRLASNASGAGPTGVLPQGTIDVESPCFSNGAYTPGCYELLAPIPGVGGSYTDGDGVVRTTGFKEQADGRQAIFTDSMALGDYINQIFRIGLGILMVVSVIMIIIAGVEYMAVESIYGKTNAKTRITDALTGLLIGLGIFLILSTINPRLLDVNFSPKGVSIGFSVMDAEQREFINSTNISGVPDAALEEILNYEPLIGYLYHQQGPGGAPSTLWAAKMGYTSVPARTPFMNNSQAVQRNINAQYGRAMSPADFVKQFYKVLKTKESNVNTIPVAHANAVTRAATEVGVNVNVLKTICMIESYDCTKAKVVNKYGYTGLFQFHPKKSWPSWRKNANSNILDPYENSYAGARFLKSNLAQYQRDKQKMR